MKLFQKIQDGTCSNSPVHDIDPRIKIAAALAVSITAPILHGNPPPRLLLLLAGAATLVYAGLWRALAVTAFFFILSMVVYLFTEAVIYWRTPQVLTYLDLALTVMPMMFYGLILGMTTPMEKMAAALEKMKVPKGLVYGFMVALRYVGVLEDEMGRLKKAMKVRGIMKSPSVILKHPVKSLKIIMLPMCMRGFMLADTVAMAAELKGLSRPGGRISPEVTGVGKPDLVFVAITASVIVTALGVSS